MKLQTLIEHALNLHANCLKAAEEALELWQQSVLMGKIEVRKKNHFQGKKIRKNKSLVYFHMKIQYLGLTSDLISFIT
jgi:hypothetical protein